ncbi:YihY/virulence factor BrkB family protein [Lyticum sinuosum]|uniref:YihY/virulence factor BrkB family protein n=1 Tax=Lyticum sinuosum TaxID=1332059 RepID=A0AAE5AHJ6_9RICK|nr:YihY/virulence factor BrkB family protein [Lyticum sinuosum]MDZ5761101.1 YihY/virulence factor BrkB family protein [Lyticum sinuosum]
MKFNFIIDNLNKKTLFLINTFYQIFIKSIKDTIKHDGIEHAGYISFLCIISLFPFIMFVTAVAGLIGKIYVNHHLNLNISVYFKKIIIQSEFSHFIDALLPRMIEITSTPPSVLMTVAVVSMIWSSSSIFEALRTILNRAYRIKKSPSYILGRLLSISKFLLVVLIILIVMIIFSILPHVLSFFVFNITPTNILYYIKILNYLTETNLYSNIFKLLTWGIIVNASYMYFSSIKQSFYVGLPGTILVIVFFSIFKKIFMFYIETMPQINLIYGSIGGIVIALLFFYFCAITFIWGAEFNYHFANTLFSKNIS